MRCGTSDVNKGQVPLDQKKNKTSVPEFFKFMISPNNFGMVQHPGTLLPGTPTLNMLPDTNKLISGLLWIDL